VCAVGLQQLDPSPQLLSTVADGVSNLKQVKALVEQGSQLGLGHQAELNALAHGRPLKVDRGRSFQHDSLLVGASLLDLFDGGVERVS
jgi:hypothetical protein